MKNAFLLSVLVLSAVACSSKESAPTPPPAPAEVAPATLEEAVAAPYRSPEMKARDVYRHPVETLQFFGLQPNMTVVEVSPSGGWYTQILAPYLNKDGQYVAAAVPSTVNEYMKNMNDQRNAWLSAHSAITAKTKTVDFGTGDIVEPDSADMVLTFRNVHNWMKGNEAQAAFNSFFKALKPGGVLGVVEHRANPKHKRDVTGKSGYVQEADVIKMAKKAGFKLEAKSEINANPKDTKDYPEGVWTLPPALKLKEVDREKYLAIGESDRMTLKFVKPAAKVKK